MDEINKVYPDRNGRITASRALDFMTKGRRKDDVFGETAKTYALELALQRLGVDLYAVSGYDITTWQMEWGIQYEADARVIYEKSRDITCDLLGFIIGDNMTGCTPDGLVGDDGLLEIKCPQWVNHFKYFREGPERRYIFQMQFQMMVTGRQWTDFMTFHPEMPDKYKAKVHRIERDETLIADMTERAILFNELVETIKDELNEK